MDVVFVQNAIEIKENEGKVKQIEEKEDDHIYGIILDLNSSYPALLPRISCNRASVKAPFKQIKMWDVNKQSECTAN